MPEEATPKQWCVSNNNGFYGWVGAGGSCLQWHPELKIGFAYAPYNHNHLDEDSFRATRMQKMIKEIVSGTFDKNQKFEESCTCAIF